MSMKKMNAFLILMTSIAVIVGDIDVSLRYVKYGVMALNILVLAGILISNRKGLELKATDKRALAGQGIFLITLLVFTMVHFFDQAFDLRYLYEFMLLLMPVLYALMIMAVGSEEKGTIMDVLFYTFGLYFVIGNLGKFSLENIMNISFLQSFSQFESSIASLYLWLFIYYLFARFSLVKSALLFAIVFFTFKRLNIILAVILLLVKILMPRKLDKRVGWGTQALVLAGALFLVWLNYQIYNPALSDYLLTNNNLSLDQLTMGRYEVTHYILNHTHEIPKGFGGLNVFLAHTDFKNFPVFHGDILKLYLELGIVGFLCAIFGIVRTACSRIALITVGCFMCILMFDHMLDYSFNYMLFILLISELNGKSAEQPVPARGRLYEYAQDPSLS